MTGTTAFFQLGASGQPCFLPGGEPLLHAALAFESDGTFPPGRHDPGRPCPIRGLALAWSIGREPFVSHALHAGRKFMQRPGTDASLHIPDVRQRPDLELHALASGSNLIPAAHSCAPSLNPT